MEPFEHLWELAAILRAADRRLGRAYLLGWAEGLASGRPALEVIQARFGVTVPGRVQGTSAEACAFRHTYEHMSPPRDRGARIGYEYDLKVGGTSPGRGPPRLALRCSSCRGPGCRGTIAHRFQRRSSTRSPARSPTSPKPGHPRCRTTIYKMTIPTVVTPKEASSLAHDRSTHAPVRRRVHRAGVHRSAREPGATGEPARHAARRVAGQPASGLGRGGRGCLRLAGGPARRGNAGPVAGPQPCPGRIGSRWESASRPTPVAAYRRSLEK